MPRGIKMTEDDRHEKLLESAKMHLESFDGGGTSGTRTRCGLEGAGGLGWVANEGEFDDRPSYRCKRCERLWLRDQEKDMNEAREQTGDSAVHQ